MLRYHTFQKLKTKRFHKTSKKKTRLGVEDALIPHQELQHSEVGLTFKLNDYITVLDIGADQFELVKKFDGINNQYINQCLLPDENYESAIKYSKKNNKTL